MKELVKASIKHILKSIDFGASGMLVAAGSDLLASIFKKRGEEARAILIEEMKTGERLNLDVADIDEFVAIVYRYSRAATEGAARLNLRLMAKVMRGQSVNPAMSASDFLTYADIISSLRREEVIYLATMLKLTKKGDLIPEPNKPNEHYDLEQSVSIQLQRTLVPSTHFPDLKSYNSCKVAVQRTGLVRHVWFTIDGSQVYAPSPLLFQLGKLADFEDALSSENITY